MATEARSGQVPDIGTSQADQDITTAPPGPVSGRLARWRDAFRNPQPSAIATASDSDFVEFAIAVLSDTRLQLLDIARRILFRRDQ